MRRSAAGWATFVLIFASACGEGEPPVPPPPEAPPAPDSAALASEPAGDTLVEPRGEPTAPVRMTAAAEAFPHAEHRGVRCTVCHTSAPDHVTHRDVECTACHGVPEGYATVPVRSEEDCLACHHGVQQQTSCATCHGPEGGGVVQVVTTLHLSRVTPPVERTLTLAHARHGSLSCTTCHTSGVHFEVTRECASCHENHHRADADCLACHEPAGDRHTREAHLGCSGSSCHERADIDQLPEVRPLCLTCHPAQRNHEEGLECVQCHATGRELARAGPGDPAFGSMRARGHPKGRGIGDLRWVSGLRVPSGTSVMEGAAAGAGR